MGGSHRAGEPQEGISHGLAAQQLGDLLQAGALAWGFDTERWTLRRVAEVIKERFGVNDNPNTG